MLVLKRRPGQIVDVIRAGDPRTLRIVVRSIPVPTIPARLSPISLAAEGPDGTIVHRIADGAWAEVIHPCGPPVRFRVTRRIDGSSIAVDLAFDDPDRHYEIQRHERRELHPRPTADAR